MAKKREERGKEKKTPDGSRYSLDGSFTSPIHSFRDLSPGTIRTVLAGSRYLQFLLALTIIGGILRFFNLGFNSLWLDEASTLTIARNSFSGIWQLVSAGEFNPPLFYWTEHIMLLFGNSEVVLRFIPAMLGTLTIPLAYLAGKEFSDRNTGIITAAAVTLSPFLLFYSQEARAYAMMLFFVSFALVFYFRAIRNNDLRDWLAAGLLAALAFWSHFYALVIIGGLVLYALYVHFLEYRRDLNALKSMAAGGILFAIVCLPLILVTIQLFAKRTESAPTFGIQGPGLIIATFQQIAGSDIALYLLGILFIAGIAQAFLSDRKQGIFILGVMILAFIISNVLSYRIPMQPRYMIFLSIVFFIGIALSHKFVLGIVSAPAAVYGFIVLLVLINAPMLAGYYSGFTKENWRGFAGDLEQQTRAGDFVVIVPGYISQPLDYYYSNATDRTIELMAYHATDLASVAAQRGNNTVYYVVTGDISAADPGGEAAAWLESNTRVVEQVTGIYLLRSG